jgi:hypothetical protein
MKAFNDISITYLRRPNLNQSGMIFAVDIVTKNPNFARDCYAAALENNLLIRPIGNTIYLMPPYTINHDEVEHALQASIHAASRGMQMNMFINKRNNQQKILLLISVFLLIFSRALFAESQAVMTELPVAGC